MSQSPLPTRSAGESPGRIVFVQPAEDASLVAGGDPLRLTLARTQDTAAWLLPTPEGEGGTMTTEEALLSLGWRPSGDGTTAPLPSPGARALLTSARGDLPLVVLKAGVRAGGTLVLDVAPHDGMPQTVESFGPVSVRLEGAEEPTVENTLIVPGLRARVIVMGVAGDQAVLQLLDGDGEVLWSDYLATDVGATYDIGDVAGNVDGAPTLRDAVAAFTVSSDGYGSVVLTGRLVTDGAEAPLRTVLAEWSPATRVSS